MIAVATTIITTINLNIIIIITTTAIIIIIVIFVNEIQQLEISFLDDTQVTGITHFLTLEMSSRRHKKDLHILTISSNKIYRSTFNWIEDISIVFVRRI